MDTTTDPSYLRLEDQLCAALYDASRAIVACYRPLLEDLGLTYSQYLVMLVLWEEGDITLRDLGTRLHLDSGTLSPLLKRLEAAGLVERRRSVVDERVLELSLTEAGTELGGRAGVAPTAVRRMTGMDDDQIRDLRSQLVVLTQTLRACTGG